MIEEISIEKLKKALQQERQEKELAQKTAIDAENKIAAIEEEVVRLKKKLTTTSLKKDIELASVFENINDAYILVDKKGNFKKINSFARRLFKLDNDFVKMNTTNVIYRDDVEIFKIGFKKVLKEGVISDFKIRIFNGDGQVRLLQINAITIYDNQGKSIGVHGIARDITDEILIRNKIEEQKKQLDIIIKNSPVGILLFKEDEDEVLVVNPALYEMLGYTKDEFLKVSKKSLTYPEDIEITNTYNAMLSKGAIDSYELKKRYLKKDGSVLWANMYEKSIKDENGSIKYNVALVEDITSERQKTLTLKTINNIAIAVLGKMDIFEIAKVITCEVASFLETDYCELYLVDSTNATFTKITGYDYVEKKSNSINNNLARPIEDSIISTVITTGVSIVENDTSTNPFYVYNDKIRLSEMAVPIINNGKIIGVINVEDGEKNYYTTAHLNVLEDIAGIVSMQLQNAINRIEQIKAQKEKKKLLLRLERSNSELQDYAHVVSHDLKSPLRGISSLISWIKEDHSIVMNNGIISSLDLIDSKVQLMDDLIVGILHYSSIDIEEEASEKVDLNKVFQDIFKALYIPKNITVEIADDFPTITGNKVRMQQLFQNLISNAIRYNDKEKGIIKIRYTEVVNGYVFSVKDNGIGISKKYHQQIFKMFNRLTNHIDSTGIGLSIVKKIVDLYGGKIWLESLENEGTEFFIQLKR